MIGEFSKLIRTSKVDLQISHTSEHQSYHQVYHSDKRKILQEGDRTIRHQNYKINSCISLARATSPESNLINYQIRYKRLGRMLGLQH